MISLLVSLALVACMVAGVYIARDVRLVDYASHRSKTPFRHVLFTNIATLVGGWMFFGLSAVGYQAGVVGYIIGFAYAVGMILLGLLVPRIKKAMSDENCDTLDDFIGSRYGSVAQFLSTSLNFIFFVAILAAQFIAMAGFLMVFTDVESKYLYYVAAVIVIAYTALAGFKGVLLTDVWQLTILSVAVIVLFAGLSLASNWEGFKNLDPEYFNGAGYGIGFLIAIVVIFPISVVVRTDLWQRIASAEDARSARRAFFLSAPILVVFYVILTTNGMLARATLGPHTRADISSFVMFLNVDSGQISTVGGQLLAGILSLGVFAALLSTADTNLNLVAISISKLFRRIDWKRFESKRLQTGDLVSDLERFLLSEARLFTVIVGSMSVGLATLFPDIVNLIVGAAAAVMVFIPSVVVTLFTGNRKPVAAVASLIAGFLALVPSMVYAPKIAMIPAAMASVLGFVVVAPFARSKE